MVYETAVSVGLVLSAFALIYLAVNLKRFHYFPLQLLFMIPALFILFSHVSILTEIAANESEANIETILTSVQGAYVWIAIFTVLYFIIMFLTETLGWIGDKFDLKKKRQKKEDAFD